MVGFNSLSKSWWGTCKELLWIFIGAILAAVSLRVFLMPNHLIDGGVIGVALILGRLLGEDKTSIFLILINLPFLYLAYHWIRRTFVLYMLFAVLLFASALSLIHSNPTFDVDPLETIFFGGALLGLGVGLIIRHGACLDGTEILAIIINRKKGYTIGQVVLSANIIIFAVYGWIFQDWHIAFQSLMTYIVAIKVIDLVIMGLDELKSVLVIPSQPEDLARKITGRLGIGLTILHGKGGFSGEAKELFFIIIDRLDLVELKELVLKEDPSAFMAIQNLSEVVYGTKISTAPTKKKKKSITQ